MSLQLTQNQHKLKGLTRWISLHNKQARPETKAQVQFKNYKLVTGTNPTLYMKYIKDGGDSEAEGTYPVNSMKTYFMNII